MLEIAQQIQSPWPQRLQNVAFFLLLACVAARPFMSEMSFEISALAGFRTDSSAEVAPPDCPDLSRTTFAILIFVAGGLWALGQGAGGERLRHRRLGGLILAFVLASAVTMFFASNKRLALVGWMEQAAFLLTGYLALQLCTVRWRFVLVLVLLAALGVTMTGKGLWEILVEGPARIEQWNEQSSALLAAQGLVEGSPNALAWRDRWTTTDTLGFTALSNVFASLLLVLVMGVLGLGLAKLRQAWAQRAVFLKARKKGELHVPTVVAVALLAIVVPLALVLYRTHSRGGTACTVMAFVAMPLVWRYRSALAARWKRALLVTACVLAIGAGAVIAYGVRHDGLVVETLTFRWMYWKGSVDIVKAHPLLGVGAGNFGPAYLPYREVRAEEAVQNPHNFIMQALAEMGIPAAVIYLAIVGGFFVVLARPRECVAGVSPASGGMGVSPSMDFGLTNRRLITLVLAVGLAVIMAREYFSVSAPAYVDVIPWTILTAGGMVAAFFAARSLANPDTDLSMVRIALGLGAAAFVFHDMINFALFQPATAAVFWLAMGAACGVDLPPVCVAGVSPAKAGRGLIAAGIMLLAAAVVAVPLAWLPVYHQVDLTRQMVESLNAHRMHAALSLAAQASQADPLNPVPTNDAANLYYKAAADVAASGRNPSLARSLHKQALELADQAIARDPQSPKYYVLRAEISDDRAQQLTDMKKALGMDPQNLRRHIDFAKRLWAAEFPNLSAAQAQLRDARRIDNGLLPLSRERLNPTDRATLEALESAADLGIRAEQTHDPKLHIEAAKRLNEVGLKDLADLHTKRANQQ